MPKILIIALALSLTACQQLGIGGTASDPQRDLEILLNFQQSLRELDATGLQNEAARLRALQESGETSPSVQLQLALVESELEHIDALETEQRNQLSLRRQIQSLAEQIQALTAIEQQINQRGQQQEINDD
jgi:aminoglycoside phosphotransferase